MDDQELERKKDTYQQAERDRDSSLLKVSSVSFVISMVFYRNFINEEVPQYAWCLIFGWIFLFASSIVQIVAYYPSLWAFKKDIEYHYDTSRDDAKKGYRFVQVINWIAPITLGIGLFLMLFFACNNLPEEWFNE